MQLTTQHCGNARSVLQVCTVFAQLTVLGKYQGPHVFVVRIRDDAGAVTPGVRIADNGPKMGLNGVDNGRLWCATPKPASSWFTGCSQFSIYARTDVQMLCVCTTPAAFLHSLPNM